MIGLVSKGERPESGSGLVARLFVNNFEWYIPALVRGRRCAMNHGVCIFDSHAVCSSMVLYYVHHSGIGVLVSPIALPFKHHLNPGDWLSPCLLDPAHRSLMRAQIEIANAIFDDIHFKAVMNSLDSGKRNTDLGPESSEDNLLAACFFHSSNEILIVPGVHAAALNWSLIWIDCLKLRPEVPAEGLCFDRAQDERHLEDLRSLREPDDVVNQ